MANDDQKLGIFDCETTGTNAAQDQIIELSLQLGVEDGAECTTWRCKPSVPISKEAQAVHGISMNDLKDCPAFSALAEEIRAAFDELDVLVGYNIEFDIAFLQTELRRAGFPELELHTKSLVDPYRLWRKFEPRSLSDAHKRFVGTSFDGAHSAAADVAATGRVLGGMIESFKLSGSSWPQIADHCELVRKNWIGPSYHFQWKNKKVVFGFGKYKNRTVEDVSKEDGGGYLTWLMRSDFPDHVKKIASAASEQNANELSSWVAQEFGVGPS